MHTPSPTTHTLYPITHPRAHSLTPHPLLPHRSPPLPLCGHSGWEVYWAELGWPQEDSYTTHRLWDYCEQNTVYRLGVLYWVTVEPLNVDTIGIYNYIECPVYWCVLCASIECIGGVFIFWESTFRGSTVDGFDTSVHTTYICIILLCRVDRELCMAVHFYPRRACMGGHGYSSLLVCLSVCLFVISECAYLDVMAVRLQ